MREIWQASVHPAEWPLQPVPTILKLWWAMWVVSTLLGNVSLRLNMRAEEIDELINANLATLMADAASIPLCVFFLILMHRVQDMQTGQRAAQAPATLAGRE